MADYVVITPVRNEAARFSRTIASVVLQTRPPIRWVIVDDGSTDGTSVLADDAARQHNWIRVLHRPDRGRRQPGSGVMEAFHEGCALVAELAWEYLVKLDGDLAFEPDYFVRCLDHFKRDPRLGIGGGLVCQRIGNGLVAEAVNDPAFHVRGATKIYRRACWEQIGGLLRLPGWDTVDELKANMLGWTTRTFPELKVEQLKHTGTADGPWRNWEKNGVGSYVACYDPLFVLAKCLCLGLRPPYLVAGLALGWGYLSGYLRRLPRVEDPEFRQYVRQQQRNRLLGRPSLWSARLRHELGEVRVGMPTKDPSSPGAPRRSAPLL